MGRVSRALSWAAEQFPVADQLGGLLVVSAEQPFPSTILMGAGDAPDPIPEHSGNQCCRESPVVIAQHGEYAESHGERIRAEDSPWPRSYGHEVGNLRCPGYFSRTMIAATFTNARKLAAFFSYRVATRRYC